MDEYECKKYFTTWFKTVALIMGQLYLILFILTWIY